MSFSYRLILIFCVASLFWSCNDPEPGSSLSREEIEITTKEYFARQLAGIEGEYEGGGSIKISEIDSEKDMVWKAWVEANDAFAEEKLIPIAALDQKNSSQWSIPEGLEPIPELPYYWGSKGSMPTEGYPMFIYLHGSGDNESEWQMGLSIAQDTEDEPSVHFIPKNPNTGAFQPWFLQGKQYAYEKLLRLTLAGGEVDPNKIYFYGASEGGYGSQRLASFYADYLAGSGPMAGGEPLNNAPVENCFNIAFNMRTGSNDTGYCRNILTQYTKDEFERLRGLYPELFDHHIELIPDKGHWIDYMSTTPWLAEHERNPYPKVVLWENFDMHRTYRKGFYNLAVNERSNEDDTSRTYYELWITGNQITLNASEVTYTLVEKDTEWNMPLKYSRAYSPVTKGKVTIYLCQELVDLEKEITVKANGETVFKGRVKPDRKHLVNSCALFFDPARLYPAAIEVEF